MVELNITKKWRRYQIFWIILFSQVFSQTIVDTPLATLSQAQKAWLVGDLPKSKRLYQQELESGKNKPVAAYNLAFLEFLENNYSKSEEYAKLSLTYDSTYSPSFLLLARIYWQNNKPKEAQSYFDKAIKYSSERYLPYFYRGLFHSSYGRFNKAISDLKAAINDYPKYSPAYYTLAQIYQKTNQWNEAKAILEKGLSVSYDAEIIWELAKISEKFNNLQQAALLYYLFKQFYHNHPNAIQNSKINSINQKLPIELAHPSNKPEVLIFPVGEDYLYNVYLGPLKVGELHAVVKEKLAYNGNSAYKVIFSLDSNPALELIASLHSDYITIIDAQTKQTIQHYLHVRENKIICDKVYDFDRNKDRFICRTVNKDGSIDYLEKWLPKNAIDGTSILFYARQVVKNRCTERVLTVIDENFVFSDIYYDDKVEPVEVRGKIENGIRISGENHYKGIVGFTGKFWGWFRGEPTYLPLQADFEIWVGRIKITMASEEEQREHKYAR